MTQQSVPEGRDGTRVAYSERLWPAWWIWLMVPALIGVLAVAYGAAYSPVLGWAIFIVIGVAATALMAVSSPVVRVDDLVLRAGRARLPLAVAGSARILDRDTLKTEVRMGDARSFLCVRGWAAPRAIEVAVVDARDPHPRWLITSRRPDALLSALEQARTQWSADHPAE